MARKKRKFHERVELPHGSRFGQSGARSSSGDCLGVGGWKRQFAAAFKHAVEAEEAVDGYCPKNGSFPLELPLVVGGISGRMAQIPWVRVCA